MVQKMAENGAGEGSRNPVLSLGSSCSTVELHPLNYCNIYIKIFNIQGIYRTGGRIGGQKSKI